MGDASDFSMMGPPLGKRKLLIKTDEREPPGVRSTSLLLPSSSSRASPTANEPRRDRHPRRKSARKPRPELWETSRKCSPSHLNEIFFELEEGMGPNAKLRPTVGSLGSDDRQGSKPVVC